MPFEIPLLGGWGEKWKEGEYLEGDSREEEVGYGEERHWRWRFGNEIGPE